MTAKAAVGAEAAERGRSAQRAERRGTILAATVRILTAEGLAAVTHRAVAREAGVPLAATTYYFDSKDELIAEALGLLVADEIERIEGRAAALGADALGSPETAAPNLAEALVPDSEAVRVLLAKYEVYLAAARSDGLRETAAHWQKAFTELARASLVLAGSRQADELAPILVAGVDGILVHELSVGIHTAVDVGRLRGRLERLFTLIIAAG